MDWAEILNNLPRSQNGPEEAHDYLWLTQNLWMAEDVWNWANSQPKTTMLRDCFRNGCNKKETNVAEFKRCASCHEVWYCGPECQKADWKSHKAGAYHRIFKSLLQTCCFLVMKFVDILD